jgi:NADP-dependent 3-hydroxy acid dehydrogenase YdfG
MSNVMFITGAASGVGAETAKLALEQGYRLALADISLEKCEQFARSLGDQDRVIAIQCDITDWESQKQALARTLDAFGRIDIVFANAGCLLGSSFVDDQETPEEWKQMTLTNVFGTAATVKIFLPELIKRQGHLLLTGSVLGRFVHARGGMYAATKWAVTGMSEAIRLQVAGMGVRVTLVEPDQVSTNFWESHAVVKRSNENMLLPENIASAVMYAISQPKHVEINEVLVRFVPEAKKTT